MNDNHGKLNLPSIQYYIPHEGEDLVSNLNCFQSCIYYILKTERNFKDDDLLEIFLGDLTFGIVENSAGMIIDICFLDGAINQHGFKIHYTLGKGVEVLPKVEALLDQGKTVIIQTYMQRVPFFMNFIGLDHELDEEHYRKNYHSYHTFLALGYDRDNLYYVEPVRNSKRYIPYEGNKTIGVIQKKELFPAFNAFFNYTYLTFHETKAPDTADVLKTVAVQSIKNYRRLSERSNEKTCYYGKEALTRLMNLFHSDTFDLKQMITQFDITLEFLLAWKIQFILNRRALLSKTLQKYTRHFFSPEINDIIKVVNSDCQKWGILRAKINKIQRKREYDAGANFHPLIDEIALLEDRIIDRLQKTDFNY